MMNTKALKTGLGIAVAIPAELAEKYRISEGKDLRLIETPNGLQIVEASEDDARIMESAEKVMKRYEAVLERLAQ